MSSASNHSLKNLGEVTLTFSIEKHAFSFKFQVVENLRRDVIFGSNLLITFSASIDLRRKLLTLLHNGKVVATLLHDKVSATQTECALIYTTTRVHVPPKSVVRVRGRFSKGKHGNRPYLLSALEEDLVIPGQPGLTMPDFIVNGPKKVGGWLVNETDTQFSLPKGYCFAHAQSVVDYVLDECQESKTVDTAVIPESHTSKQDQQHHHANVDEISVPHEVFNQQEDLAHLSNSQKDQLQKLLDRYDHLFADSDAELGQTDVVKMELDTGDAPPIRQRPYRTPIAQQAEIERQVQSMLENNIIRHSKSPWASPVVIVPKKDGTKRFCVSYVQLNKVLKFNSYPLPNIDDIWPSLKGAKFFCSLDLRSGYWQIAMKEEDKPKTAFVCSGLGLFEFNVMPFGLSTAPPTFQYLMDVVLGELKNKIASAFLDDLIVWANSFENMLINLEKVFKKLEEAGLKMKRSKCQFFLQTIKYLGHLVSAEGLRPDPDKVKAMQNLKAPTNVKEVRSVVGSTSYYRRFIQDYAEIAKPLIALTKKNTIFSWGPDQQRAFDTLKAKLMEAPVLAYADPSKPYRLYTDASKYCVGAVLTQPDDEGQGEKPIYFLSHQLSAQQQNWPTIEREMYGIIYAVSKLRHYLIDATFTVVTDHQPLKHLFTSEMHNARVQRWAVMLEEYNFDVEWTKGSTNVMADMLSRQCEPDPTDREVDIEVIDSSSSRATVEKRLQQLEKIPDVETIDSLVNLKCAEDLMKQQHEDPDLQPIILALLKGDVDTKLTQNYVLQDNVLYHVAAEVKMDMEPRLQLVIPQCLQPSILQELHSSNHSAHLGLEKTYHKARVRYFWKNMYRDIAQYIEKCTVCTSRRIKQQRVPLEDMPMPGSPFEIVGIDLCGPYPETDSGDRYLFTLTDHFSSWPEAFPIKNKSAETIAEVLLEKVIPRHSCPRLIISDRGTEFNNSLVAHITSKLKVAHIRTSAFHPQSNGRAERFHRYMVESLAKLMLKDPDQSSWDKYVPSLLLAYRTSVHSSSRFTPFFLVYGRDPVLPLDTLLRPHTRYQGDDYVPTMLQRLHRAFVLTKQNTEEARQRNQELVSRKVEKRNFRVGDAVFYQDIGHVQSKLSSAWQPYFRIVEQLSPVNFRIKDQLTGESRVVHAERLYPAHSEHVWDKEIDALGDFNFRLKSDTPKRIQPLRESKLAMAPSSESQQKEDPEWDMPLSWLRQKLRKEGNSGTVPLNSGQVPAVPPLSQATPPVVSAQSQATPPVVSAPSSSGHHQSPVPSTSVLGKRRRDSSSDDSISPVKKGRDDLTPMDVDLVDVKSNPVLKFLRFLKII